MSMPVGYQTRCLTAATSLRLVRRLSPPGSRPGSSAWFLIDRLRTLTVAREHGLMQSAAAPELPTANNDPSLAPDCRRARQAFEQLPEGQRLVVQLGYFEGLTCQEIATRCDIPLGTVKSRLAAAIMKLRKILSSHWEHADATR